MAIFSYVQSTVAWNEWDAIGLELLIIDGVQQRFMITVWNQIHQPKQVKQIHVYIYKYKYTYVNIYVYIYIHIDMYIYINIYIYWKNEHGVASGMPMNLGCMSIPHISAEFLRRPARSTATSADIKCGQKGVSDSRGFLVPG